ncbi:Uncharacterised protein [Burkholderia pseudomallei]|nr:Uncharacterised protein [Burkholderia pseudomallei]CAJ2792213.1 Uncharacterised protein [Burkholderia pseudomallei]CAJ2816774.1 Uncharacterised protein [Burkholderia pseudomallei]CAJ2817192.1 Uncharacterised protein [Burkholderia pseudomallei]CAJ3113368.1 Uncharacterised protein [Burkholderia pseudomallei]
MSPFLFVFNQHAHTFVMKEEAILMSQPQFLRNPPQPLSGNKFACRCHLASQ